MSNEPLRKYPSVIWALALLLTTLALGPVRFLLGLQGPPVGPNQGLILIVGITTLSLVLLLVWCIAIGKHWARIVYLVFTVLGLPTALQQILADLPSYPWSFGISLIQLLGQVAALVLLFLPASAPWFHSTRSVLPTTPSSSREKP